MVTLTMTEEQLKKIEGLVDLLLKTAGLAALKEAVEMVNLIAQAQKVEKE